MPAVPGTKTPNDLDFADLTGFTIGMCFQVPDVVITSLPRAPPRRFMHALVSFRFNTTILALSLNLLTTLLN